jgi:hypothetical protein
MRSGRGTVPPRLVPEAREGRCRSHRNKSQGASLQAFRRGRAVDIQRSQSHSCPYDGECFALNSGGEEGGREIERDRTAREQTRSGDRSQKPTREGRARVRQR